MKPSSLLAKMPQFSGKPFLPETLIGHTDQVLQSAQTTLDVIFHSEGSSEIRQLWHIIKPLALLGAIFHDLGKATNIFQGMLDGDEYLRNKVHPVRHEILSALIIAQIDGSIKEWVGGILNPKGLDFLWMVSWIAGGHHLKLHRDHPFKTKVTDRLVRTQGIPTEFVFWGSHPDISDLLKKVCLVLEVSEDWLPVADTVIPLQEEDDPTIQHIESIVEDYVDQSKDLAHKLSREKRFCLALAKGIVISSDVAGSALPRK